MQFIIIFAVVMPMIYFAIKSLALNFDAKRDFISITSSVLGSMLLSFLLNILLSNIWINISLALFLGGLIFQCSLLIKHYKQGFFIGLFSNIAMLMSLLIFISVLKLFV